MAKTHENQIGEIATRYFFSRANEKQRFGQFFVEWYLPPDAKWSELFYEEDNAKAFYMVMEFLANTRCVWCNSVIPADRLMEKFGTYWGDFCSHKCADLDSRDAAATQEDMYSMLREI